MSDQEKEQTLQEDQEQDGSDQEYDYESEDSNTEGKQIEKAPQQGQRTMQRARQGRNPAAPTIGERQGGQQQQFPVPVPMEERRTGAIGGRTGAIRESRIKDRPVPENPTESSLKIKIELDLEVEVDLYARVKGDVTIGLM